MYIVLALFCHKKQNSQENNVEKSAQTCFSIRMIKQYSAKKTIATELKQLPIRHRNRKREDVFLAIANKIVAICRNYVVMSV